MTERFTVEVDITAKDKTSNALTGVKRGFNEAFNQVVTGALRKAGESALQFVQQLPAMAIDLTKLGIAAQATEQRFTRFAGGTERAAEFLQAFQQGTDNTVDRMSAMGSAARLLQMGLVSTGDEMSTIASIAVKLGDQTTDAGARIADFSALLANQSIPRLDNFGISSGRVRQRIQELLETGQALNREQAFKLAVMEEGAKSLEILGDTTDTAATKMAILQAALEDAKLGFAEMAAGAVAGAGGVDSFADRIRNLPDTLRQAISFLDAAQAGITAWGQGGPVDAAARFQEAFTNSLKRSTAEMINFEVASEEVRFAYTLQAEATNESATAADNAANSFSNQANMGDFASVSMERMATASEANIEALKQQQEAAENAAIAQAGLAANLKDATDAQIAQVAISQLGQALEDGEITLETYTTAVTETQLAFGLADEQSIFLTESLSTLTASLADGSLQAEGYDEALGAVIQQSMAAGTEVETFANALDGLPDKVEIEIVTKFRTEGSLPAAAGTRIGGEREDFQHGTAFASGGLALVGERGPELAFIPRGASVLPTDQSRHITNNFNLSVNSRATSMGVASEFSMMQGLSGL